MRRNLAEFGGQQIAWDDPGSIAKQIRSLIRHERPFAEYHDQLNDLLITKPTCENWNTYHRFYCLVERYRQALAEGAVSASGFQNEIVNFSLD